MTGGSGAAQVWCRISFHNGAIHLATACRLCSTAALQHCSTAVCTQRRNLIAISVSTGAVSGAMGVC